MIGKKVKRVVKLKKIRGFFGREWPFSRVTKSQHGTKSLFAGLEIEGDGKDLDNFEAVVPRVDKAGVPHESNSFSSAVDVYDGAYSYVNT